MSGLPGRAAFFLDRLHHIIAVHHLGGIGPAFADQRPLHIAHSLEITAFRQFIGAVPDGAIALVIGNMHHPSPSMDYLTLQRTAGQQVAPPADRKQPLAAAQLLP